MLKFKYEILFVFGFIIWFIGTWTGGWSNTPQSNFERMTDFVGGIFMVWGIVGDILNNLTIVKEYRVSARLRSKK